MFVLLMTSFFVYTLTAYHQICIFIVHKYDAELIHPHKLEFNLGFSSRSTGKKGKIFFLFICVYRPMTIDFDTHVRYGIHLLIFLSFLLVNKIVRAAS